MGHITVFSGPERRRRWSDEERLRILTEAFSPGAKVVEVARRHDVSTALIYTWRRKHREARSDAAPPELPSPRFAEAVMFQGDVAPASTSPAIVVELARRMRVSIFATATPAVVAAALKALR